MAMKETPAPDEPDRREAAPPDAAGDQFDVKTGDVGPGAQIAVGKDIRQTSIGQLIVNVAEAVNLRPLTLITLITLIGVGAALFILVRPLLVRAEMEGTFNIAVAALDEVAEGRSRSSEEGEKVASWLAERLAAEQPSYPEGTIVEIWGPDQTGRVAGATAEARSAAAEELARDIGANIVVYGYLERENDDVNIYPEFYVATQGFEFAQEVTGPYEMGSVVRATVEGLQNPVIGATVNRRLNARALALSHFTIGLIYSSMEEFAAARAAFEQALAVPDWSEEEGKEVLYLFLGNAALNLDEFAAAHDWYGRALAANPDYARAFIGDGFTYFQEAIAPMPEAPVDVALLDRSVAAFNEGMNAPIQPPNADVGPKAHFGIGRAYLVKSWQGDADLWVEAESELRQVTDAYEAGNVRLQELAAQAYGQLGLLYYILGDDAAAIAAYTEALELGELERFQAEWAGWLGRIYDEQGDAAEATRYAAEADRFR
jgi:tetratricopeptide (TPR) repeat protein